MPSVLRRRYRIVVALDRSEYAEIVLEHALDLAARHDAPELHFVTVVEHDRGDDLTGVKNDLAGLVLEGLATFGDDHSDWRARLHVRAGKPADEIVALASDIDADLIAIGRFGHRTVTQRVVERSPCPVLAVNLQDRPLDGEAQCTDCVQLRADTDGERWFCAAHSAPDRATLATTAVGGSLWTGGTLMW